MRSNFDSNPVVRAVRQRLPSLIYEVLIEGYCTWWDASVRTYDAKENSVTASLLPFFARAGIDPRRAMTIVRNAASSTATIEAGCADPDTAPLPDISVYLPNSVVPVGCVECKWVMRSPPRASDITQYVDEGIARFAPGGPYQGLSRVSVMLGYAIERGAIPRLVDRINLRVCKQYSVVNILVHNGPVHGHEDSYESRPYDHLQHLFLEIPRTRIRP